MALVIKIRRSFFPQGYSANRTRSSFLHAQFRQAYRASPREPRRARRRFMNTLELFNVVNIEYFEKIESRLVRIDNADLEESNMDLGSSFKRMCIASFFTEFVDRLTKEKQRE